MTESQVAKSKTSRRTTVTTFAAVALVLSPILAVAAMAGFPDTSNEIVMVQTTQWVVLWTLGLGASLLFALGSSGLFGSVIGKMSDRSVRLGLLFTWIAFLLMAVMFALNVTAARMLVVPDSTAILPASQQQVGLDMIEATTSGLYIFAVAFVSGAALLFGRTIIRSSAMSSRVGTAGQVLGTISLVVMVVVMLTPNLIGYEIGFLLTFLLGIVIYVWGLAVGISVFRGRTVPKDAQ